MLWQKTHSRENRHQNSVGGQTAKRFAAHLHRVYLALVEAIEGIEEAEVCSRYASLLIYRLLFLYFLQHLGLLADDPRYLQHRLRSFQEQQKDGAGFYREVLHPLFTASTRQFRRSIVDLFSSREIEQSYPAIAIADESFARIFALFDDYHWQTDDRTGQHDREITPEILGALFERKMHPKEMGAYYTPCEVTAYIARNTLLPALFTRTRALYGETVSLLWQTLVSQPARYIFPAARKGHERAFPPEIAAGIEDITLRTRWQMQAPEPFALPGETWRDVIARRERVDEIIADLKQSSPGNLDRLVTWNLDQHALALDTLRHCRQPAFLEACYQSLRQLTILDPTCGSGAFLCAALLLLEDLYAACLARMEELCSPLAPVPLTPGYLRSFHAHLEEAGGFARRALTSLNWIIEHNLYGVDLNEEAAEICRMRLFLKLAAAGSDQGHTALPHAFAQHIRVGNSLVGSLTNSPGKAAAHAPEHVHYQRAFHWNQAFPEPMKRGGFDVILGNPPYVEYQRVREHYTVDGYATLETGNLYALTMERGADLLAPGGRFGMIVPSSATCTDGYFLLQKLLLAQQELHIASFSDQRGRLFALPHARLCIICYTKAASAQIKQGKVFTTPYIKLGRETRDSLFEHLNYIEVTPQIRPGIIPRYGSPLEQTIHNKLARQAYTLGHYLQPTGAYPVYYTRKLSWFVQVTPFIPRILDAQGQARPPSELKTLRFASYTYARIAFAALNSNLFYWLITTGSDCRNLNRREVLGLPLDLAAVQPGLQQELCNLADRLKNDLHEHARMRAMAFQNKGSLTIQCIYPARSKHLIDEIDRVLACHYEFSPAELDFLLHYDEKYRRSD